MDGNGRWAARVACPAPTATPRARRTWPPRAPAVRRNIGYLTVFGFSTENWRRPRPEVRHIMGLHEKLFGRVAELNELNVRIQWIGRPFDSREAKTPTLRAAGDPQGDRRHRPATPAWSSRWRSTTAAAPNSSTAVEAAQSAGGDVTTAVDRRPPLPARAAAGRRPGAHERRASHVQLPALAVRRRGDLLHRAPWPEFDAAPSSTPAPRRLTASTRSTCPAVLMTRGSWRLPG